MIDNVNGAKYEVLVNLTKGIWEFFVLFLQTFVNLKLYWFILIETWVQECGVT